MDTHVQVLRGHTCSRLVGGRPAGDSPGRVATLTVFQSGRAASHSRQQGARAPTAPRPHRHLSSSGSGRPRGAEVASRRGFGVHFPHDQWCRASFRGAHGPFVYLLWRNVYANTLLVFTLGYLSFRWVARVLRGFRVRVPHRICGLEIFPPVPRSSFAALMASAAARTFSVSTTYDRRVLLSSPVLSVPCLRGRFPARGRRDFLLDSLLRALQV